MTIRAAFQSAQLKIFVGDSSTPESIREASALLASTLNNPAAIPGPDAADNVDENEEDEEIEEIEKEEDSDEYDENNGVSATLSSDPFKVFFVMNKVDLVNDETENGSASVAMGIELAMGLSKLEGTKIPGNPLTIFLTKLCLLYPYCISS